MSNIAWRLSQSGHLLEIFKVDPGSRMLTLLQALRCSKPMNQETALKYIENNYPKNGSAVTLAAEALNAARRRT